jgi:uncharacterized protein
MASRAHREDVCKRCGRCCYAKVIVDDEIYYTDIPCQHLDVATNLCTVYERRFEVDEDCLRVEEGIRHRVFPGDCPYVKGLKGYRAPHTDCDRKEMGRVYRDTP